MLCAPAPKAPRRTQTILGSGQQVDGDAGLVVSVPACCLRCSSQCWRRRRFRRQRHRGLGPRRRQRHRARRWVLPGLHELLRQPVEDTVSANLGDVSGGWGRSARRAVCRAVGRTIGRSVGRSGGPAVGRSFGQSVVGRSVGRSGPLAELFPGLCGWPWLPNPPKRATQSDNPIWQCQGLLLYCTGSAMGTGTALGSDTQAIRH